MEVLQFYPGSCRSLRLFRTSDVTVCWLMSPPLHLRALLRLFRPNLPKTFPRQRLVPRRPLREPRLNDCGSMERFSGVPVLANQEPSAGELGENSRGRQLRVRRRHKAQAPPPPLRGFCRKSPDSALDGPLTLGGPDSSLSDTPFKLLRCDRPLQPSIAVNAPLGRISRKRDDERDRVTSSGQREAEGGCQDAGSSDEGCARYSSVC
jgi:hypothetical protein